MSTTGGGPSLPVAELGPVSPELALVDPDLARAARELLSEPPQPQPITEQSVFVERLQKSLEPIPDSASRRPQVRLSLLSSAAGLVALAVVVTLLAGREKGSAPRQQQAQSVAGAISPARSAPPATSSPRNVAAIPGHTFVWASQPKAAAYDFQLFQGGQRVFRARVDKPRIELPGRWRWAGLPHALLAGSYRWYVWPVSRGTSRRSMVPIVDSRLVVEAQPR